MPELPKNPILERTDTVSDERDAVIDDDVRSDFANLEDKGGWLTVRVRRSSGGSVPVRIARAAMEDHFGAGPGEKGLAEAFLAHREAIDAKVLELAPSGDLYTTENPMRLGTGDFD